MNIFEQLQVIEQVAANNQGKVSDKYGRVDSRELINTVQKILPMAEVSIKKSKGRANTKHIIEFKLNNQELFLFGDKLIPRIVLVNSYNGESSLQIRIGLYRLVCSNGLIIGQDTYRARVVHRKGETLQDYLRGFEREIRIAAQQFENPAMSSQLTEKLGRVLPLSTQVQVVDELSIPLRVKRNIVYILTEGRLHLRNEDATGTLWALYNVVNEIMRRNSRSAYRNAVNNLGLMDQIINIANTKVA